MLKGLVVVRMTYVRLTVTGLACVLAFVGFAHGQEQPIKVTACQLQSDPPAYNHKLVEVTAFVSHGFEDFTLFDPTCSDWGSTEVWLEYGGKTRSGTIYCCGVTEDRTRPKEAVIEDIPIPLKEDEWFHKFDELIQDSDRRGRRGAMAHATLVGRYFSGHPIHFEATGITIWGGYGHLGMHTLLAIQEVKSVSPQDRKDLDYDAYPDQPELTPGCSFREHRVQADDLIEAQQQADQSPSDWAFDTPVRVATRAVVKEAMVDAGSIIGLNPTREAQGRIVYQSRPNKKGHTYMVVVSHPFWLALHARDPKRVAWVATAVYESYCGEYDSSTQND